MTILHVIGIILIIAITIAVGIPIGQYLYQLFGQETSKTDRFFLPMEKLLYRLIGVNPSVKMDWKAYLRALLIVNLVMMVFVYLVLRLQGFLPLNPSHKAGLSWDLAFNTATSFITNTNWQSYSGEQSLSYFSQMVGITFLQFTSAATGFVAAIAFLRALVAHKKEWIGNFWVDLIKIHTRVLLPVSVVFAVVFIALGVPQTLQGTAVVHTLSGHLQAISRGPIASLEVIKQFGTNGGGYMNANSAHPFEDPSAWTTVLEMVLMGSVSAGLVWTFGLMIKNRKQAIVLYVFLTAILLLGAFLIYASESAGNPLLAHLFGLHGPNMEGKEVRFGTSLSSVFAAMTTAFTTGAVNATHDSFMPLGGMVPMIFMMFNLVFGGKGVGLLNILMFLIITVFLSGLMVGRTPEVFGKKIEAKEIKLATMAMLVHPFLILIPTALFLSTKSGIAMLGNPGLHGLSEMLYAFTSGAANNGSAFAGLSANNVFFNVTQGIVMILGRYVSLIAMFAIAGSLAKKAVTPNSVGTLKTDTFAFGGVFVAVFVIVGALTFFPALAIGPIGEHFSMWATLNGHP